MRKARDKINGKASESLDLSTTYPRRHVKIDGAEYEMIHPGEMSLWQTRNIEFQRKRLAVLMSSDEPNEKGEAEITGIMVFLMQAMMPDLPADVARKLPDREKIRAVDFFFRAAAPIESETEPTTTRPDGASSVSGSSGSTEQPTHSAGAG